MQNSSKSRKVLFVCLGNICRSPMAEAVFTHLVKVRGLEHQWDADSAGTGSWHIGSRPDSRTTAVLSKHSIVYNGRARQIHEDDFNNFDFIFGMDENNISDIKGEAPKNSKAKIELLGEYDPEGVRIIKDPYYDRGTEGFDLCYQQCMRCCTAFLDKYLQ